MTRTLSLVLFLTACHGESSLGSMVTPTDGGASPRAVFGSVLWELTFSGTGEDGGRAVALLPSGDLVLSATYGGTIDFGDGPRTTAAAHGHPMLMRRARADGALQWIRDGVGGDVAVDSAGDVIVLGGFAGSLDFGGQTLTTAPFPGTSDSYSSAYVAKYAGADGSLLWVRGLGAASWSYGTALAVGSDGTVYAAGSYRGTAELATPITNPTPDSADAFLIAIESDGTDRWSLNYPTTYGVSINAMASPPGGDLVVTFNVSEPMSVGGSILAPSPQGTILARLSSAGAHLSSALLGDLPDYGNNLARAVAIGASGEAFLVKGAWLRAFDATGLELWNMHPALSLYSVVVAPDGTLLVEGSGGLEVGLGGTIQDRVTFAFDPDGSAADQSVTFGTSYAPAANGEIAYVSTANYSSISQPRSDADIVVGVRAAP